MTDVRCLPSAGQEATLDPAIEARNLLNAIRVLAFDAAAPQGERKHTRRHLRWTLKAHFRALETRLDALDAVRPLQGGNTPAPEAPPAP